VAELCAVANLLQNRTEFGGQTYQFNVRGDEIVPEDGPNYATTNTWQSGLGTASIPQIMELPGFNLYGLQLSDNNR
jgi:hypothetical protein